MAEEIDDLCGNAFGHFVRLGKFAVAVAGIRENDGDDFVQIAVDIRHADAVERMEDIDGFAERRRADVGLDIVHAVQFDVLRQVDFNDDFLGNFNCFVGVSDAHCRDDFSVFRNGAGFDDGHIELTVKTLAHLLFDMRQVHVLIGDVTGVDVVAQGGVGLEGAAEADGVGGGQYAVAFGRGGGTGNDANAERPSGGVFDFCSFGNGGGQGFGITCAGEAGYGQCHAVADEFGRLFGGHDFTV